MDVRALRYFSETVRCASFTEAARHLFVTQSTVSKMIRQLEEEVGTPLLIRDGHTARPTDTGRIVYERSLQILAAMRQLSAEVKEAADLERGELEVGIPPMINLLFIPVVRQFRERYPRIQLSLREGAGQEVERLVAAGELEVGATVLPVAAGGPLESRRFGLYSLWALGPSDAPWANRTTLPLSALRDVPLLIPTEDFALTRRLRQACESAGFDPRIAAQSAHWDFLAAMASSGLGTAILPEPLVQRLKTRGLSTARLARSGVQWEVGHIWVRDRYLSHAARAWLEICSAVLTPPATLAAQA
ncbi:LysR family transcriptional regulator [Bordetella avium]|uniref:LysR-family transcriptional regulator n=1 Tax=Bordetella avium (strain 197N) TaxID=360910 RepID=Q2KXC5_BORA1|nr:LysR family transcriptional regulator [Bordetella avium]AZY49869.1 LysR family transcriptional regulator [Bordetella avium]AZY53209.1 LysR family transcriptional regulator [Bordetella avium]RIQ17225.1 LysR family transcriptional regulator [Bordetella avium]RIQ33711.1 LysR family transcriptional regulator [Bordetella avium]RIQ51904.1 LysR family transcriptional regulator [Bordetella avium]